MNATQVLNGRREGALLAFPSVQHMTDTLSRRCREQSWLRTSVASLERFRTMTGNADLEALLHRALAEPEIAEHALTSFAAVLANYADSQVSALAMGVKIWFRLNGVPVSWRPLGGIPTPLFPETANQQGAERLVLLALIGSGLRLTELLRLRIGDIGSLDSDGRLIPDVEADPLAVQHVPRMGKPIERITFFTYQTRQALLAHVKANGQSSNLAAPLIAQHDGSHLSVARARQRSRALIRAGSNVNIELCRTTGNFFREWGLPGSHFVGPEELNIEEFMSMTSGFHPKAWN